MEFDKDVEKALEEQVPLFYRRMARKGLEDYARQKGAERVTMEIFIEAREKYLSGQS
jgi:hypothetical protein